MNQSVVSTLDKKFVKHIKLVLNCFGVEFNKLDLTFNEITFQNSIDMCYIQSKFDWMYNNILNP